MECLWQLPGFGYESLTSILFKKRKVNPENIFLLGCRDLDSGEIKLINDLEINMWTIEDIKNKGAKATIEELLEEIKKYPSDQVYCIGGDSVYKQLLPYCDIAHVTKIDFGYEADSYFPNLDEDPQWHVAAESEEQTYFDLEYKFVRYERNK